MDEIKNMLQILLTNQQHLNTRMNHLVEKMDCLESRMISFEDKLDQMLTRSLQISSSVSCQIIDRPADH
ncbi:hypothetical protein CLV97_12449 [Planifilum fimeticola]|uniref:Uncharacterized protein n=1 Tax=Planifilum fimeticola TaxID=201975 RepID=A0A2T0LC62_9BACL|nr:hypothetical protein [Planifilum fimeticola]PRX39511.1 hypothetical protein CLV97_12449 [Planifilum fimeticola]